MDLWTVELSFFTGATESVFTCTFFPYFVGGGGARKRLWDQSVSSTAVDTFHAFIDCMPLGLHEL